MMVRSDSVRARSAPRSRLRSLVGAFLLSALLTGTLVAPLVEPIADPGPVSVGTEALQGRAGRLAADTPGAAVERTFEWTHAGRTWSLTVAGDQALLDDYAQRDRLLYSHDYRAYALDSSGAAWITDLAHELDALHRAGGIETPAERVAAILAFVQHLPYGIDAETTGHREWPRYPMETLFSEANDCEDTSVLFVNLVRALGFDAILINPPRHMAAGIDLGLQDGVTVTHAGQEYSYVETTGPGWDVGQVPRAFADGPFRPLGLEPRPILSRPSIETHVVAKTVQATLTVHNVGDALAREVVLGVTFQASPGGTWAEAHCEPAIVFGETSRTCSVLLEAPPAGDTFRLSAWARTPDAPTRSTLLDWSQG